MPEDEPQAWLYDQLRTWPPLPDLPTSLEPFACPQGEHFVVAKCGGTLEIGEREVRLGGFACRSESKAAELVARCELAERLLALEAMVEAWPAAASVYSASFAVDRLFSASLQWDADLGRFIRSGRVYPSGEVLIGLDRHIGSTGLGLGDGPLRALKHATFEVLERALFGLCWYEAHGGWVSLADDDWSGHRRQVFQYQGRERLPLVLVVRTDIQVDGVFVGIALRGNTQQALVSADQESLMLWHDARRNHSAPQQGQSPHARVMATREVPFRQSVERHLKSQQCDALVEEVCGSFTQVVAACFELIRASCPQATLTLIPVAQMDTIHVVRARLEGVRSLSEQREFRGALPHDPIA